MLSQSCKRKTSIIQAIVPEPLKLSRLAGQGSEDGAAMVLDFTACLHELRLGVLLPLLLLLVLARGSHVAIHSVPNW